MRGKGHVTRLLFCLVCVTSAVAQTANVPELERSALVEIRAKGAGDRFRIDSTVVRSTPMIVVSSGGSGPLSRVSFQSCLPPVLKPEPLSPVSVTLTSAVDLLPKGNPAAQEAYQDLRDSVALLKEFPTDTISMGSLGCEAPVLDNTIHRVLGSVTIGPYRFISEGDKDARLTFALVKDLGYVYLRGRGKVVLPDGKQVVLSPDSAATIAEVGTPIGVRISQTADDRGRPPTSSAAPAQSTFPGGVQTAVIDIQRIANESIDGKAASAKVRALVDKRALQDDLQGLQQQLQASFEQKLSPVIREVATERGVQIVLSKADSGIVWADAGLDITDEVIKRFDGMSLAVLPASVSIPATSDSEDSVTLLFAYSPSCPHCAYQEPVIKAFEQNHPNVKVTHVRYGEFNDEQKNLIKGTSGHPVMVFYNGKCIRQVVGKTALAGLEKEYDIFKSGLQGCLQARSGKRTTTGSRIVCR